jgi:hypothetical protein
MTGFNSGYGFVPPASFVEMAGSTQEQGLRVRLVTPNRAWKAAFFRPESFEHALIQDSPGIGVRLGQVSSKSWPFLAISAPPRPRTNTCLLPSGTKPRDARRGDGTAVAMGHSNSNAPLPRCAPIHSGFLFSLVILLRPPLPSPLSPWRDT